MSQLISRAWEGYHKRKTLEFEKNSKFQILQVQKELAERDVKIAQIIAAKGNLNIESIISDLRAKSYKVQNGVITLAEVFHHYANLFAAGVVEGALKLNISNTYFEQSHYDLHSASNGKYYIEDFTGPLVLAGVIKVYPPQGDNTEIIYITDVGITVARELSNFL